MRVVSRHQLGIAVGVLVLAAGSAGCGGGGGASVASGPKSAATATESTAPTTTRKETTPSHPATPSISVPADPEKAIRDSILAVLAPRPPGPASSFTACGFFVTDRYVETTYGTRQGCIRALVPGSAADSVKVSAVVVRGRDATARAVPNGRSLQRGDDHGAAGAVQVLLEDRLAPLQRPGRPIATFRRGRPNGCICAVSSATPPSLIDLATANGPGGQVRTWTMTVRSRGRSSKSTRTSCCQVPRMRRPSSTGSVSDGPITEARWWACELLSWLSRLCS